MAGAKPTLNPLTDTPKSKTEVTKPFMLAYMKSEKATQEDREWFKTIVSNPENQKMYRNRLTNASGSILILLRRKREQNPLLIPLWICNRLLYTKQRARFYPCPLASSSSFFLVPIV